MTERSRGDRYDDLAEAVERGTLKRDRRRERKPIASDQQPEIEPSRGGDCFDDLIEAVERGAVDGDNGWIPVGVRSHYTVTPGTWKSMRADLLGQLLADVGSIRRLAPMLDVSRSTLGAWYRQARQHARDEPG